MFRFHQILFGLLFLLSASCTKDRFCACTVVDTSGIVADSTFTYVIEGKKKKAEADCESASITFGTFIQSCVLLE